MTTDASNLVASGYEAFYTAWGKTPTLRQIWREHVTGSEYPRGVRAHQLASSCPTTVTERRFVRHDRSAMRWDFPAP
jgi:hypothetical protein